MNIKCYTLYDITQTGVIFRKKFIEITDPNERKQRSQQSNLDTILQVINMRSQPEDITQIVQTEISKEQLEEYDFGYVYAKDTAESIKVWSFVFSIEHVDVFNNGIHELGYLLEDCNQVPMIANLDESVKLSSQLDISDSARNIYFEILK